MKLAYSLIALLVGLSLSPIVSAQECAPPPITANSAVYNIFTPEQETILGELTYQRMQGDLRFIRDQQIDDYLNALAQKLIKHLPPTGLKFQFHVVDIPEANAFNTPGGYVFISRKLIGFANNEDELAGVIAHELGHATVRHSASDFSNYLKLILNVTQVTDRKDIAEKYNLWTLGSDAGKERLKSDPTLAAKAKTLGNKDDDYLLEVVDAFAGKTVGSVLLETGKGSFDIETAYSEGDWLVLRDSENRVLAYSIVDGELKHRFFGSYATINPKVNEVVVENYPGELTFYNLSSGEQVAK